MPQMWCQKINLIKTQEILSVQYFVLLNRLLFNRIILTYFKVTNNVNISRQEYTFGMDYKFHQLSQIYAQIYWALGIIGVSQMTIFQFSNVLYFSLDTITFIYFSHKFLTKIHQDFMSTYVNVACVDQNTN